ncbi:hypothetical protein CDD81_1027 [Ophiocordyceps australis]|uniref:Origin recognition complex subunit 2 n=1 Tax=Ophiocordyceps australis TaxID=1399860 RepID=A0A2C5XZS5_9HYPO|nr:hypothetical protein CDD81_1027 [Ophiocordyceps australis]
MPPRRKPSEVVEPRKRKRTRAAADTESPPTLRQRSSSVAQQLPTVQELPEASPEDCAAATDKQLENDESFCGHEDEFAQNKEPESATTTPKRRGPSRTSAASSAAPTPKSQANVAPLPSTPSKAPASQVSTPRRLAADRSARKKSVRALVESVARAGASDSDFDATNDEILAQEIYGDSETDGHGVNESHDESDTDAAATTQLQDESAADEAATPSKRKRGRPRRVKSPTPPKDLPPHEMYFFHNKPGRPKTSDNTLSSLALLTHEEYFDIMRRHKDHHSAEIDYLEALHAESFPQWAFELSQGFSLCLYGYGSKRSLLQRLAKYLHSTSRHHSSPNHKTVIVNGHAPAANTRDILSCIASAIDSKHKLPVSTPSAAVANICSLLSTKDTLLTLIINSIDAPPLRKASTQTLFAQLAAHPCLHLICSADTPDFPILWDTGLRSAFSFVFHDCTTFAPLADELNVVDDVHHLLGRASRRINGREGVAFVLRSLPENARNLFRLLASEILVACEDADVSTSDLAAIEYRTLYNKAVEEFICSSEMAFRTLLKEFHDHQMIASRKDTIGAELLSVPFPKDELEAILEDLMS